MKSLNPRATVRGRKMMKPSGRKLNGSMTRSVARRRMAGRKAR